VLYNFSETSGGAALDSWLRSRVAKWSDGTAALMQTSGRFAQICLSESASLLPLVEHAIAYLNEFRVRFNVGVQFPSSLLP